MSDSIARVSRRRFCEGAFLSSGAALATLLAGCGGGGAPTSPSEVTSTLGTLSGQFSGSVVRASVAGSALSEVGGAALVQSTAGSFLVSRSAADAFTAIEATCTHEGCTVTEANSSGFVCPCHGSRYSRTGQVLAGPATASLRRYTTTFADGVVTIAL
jgi:Rieske Fe-S protein